MLKRLVCMLLFTFVLICGTAFAETPFSPVGTWLAVRLETPEASVDLVALDAAWPLTFREDMTVSIDGDETVWRHGEGDEIIVTGAESGKNRFYRPSTYTDKDGTELPCLSVEGENQDIKATVIFVREELVSLPEPEPAIARKYYTGLTEAFYTGTWELSGLALQGKVNRDPAAHNVFMTISLTEGNGLWITGQEGSQSVTIISGTAVEQPVPEEDTSVSCLRFQMKNGRYAYLIPMTNGQLCLSLSDTTVFLFDPVTEE